MTTHLYHVRCADSAGWRSHTAPPLEAAPKSNRHAIVDAAWRHHKTPRERMRALRAAVPHLQGRALVTELAALVRAASGRHGVNEVRARVERLAAYLDPRTRARLRNEAAALRDAPFVAVRYSPVVRGRARQYAAQYRGYRVVQAGRTADGSYSTDVRCDGVRVVWDSGAVYNGGPRSQGYQAREFAERLARHRNLLHAVARGKARVTVEDITSEPNEELRRELIATYGGFDRYAADAGGELIHEDETGRLVRIPAAGEPIAVAHVVCPTTGRQYALRVPPSCTSAREAVAWTFGLRAEEYRPTSQS